ncbi:hypothetical protein AOLI_G00231510 [Acnodon oligacanthus]
MGQPSLRQVPMKEEGFSDLNLYLLIAIVSVSVIFLLSLIGLMAAKCCGSEGGLSRCSGPVVTTHPDGSWSYSKATQQYDVCFSSDTLKSDVVVFPSPFPPADAELISINGGDTFTRTQTLPSSGKGTNLFRIGSSSGEIRTKRRMSDHDLKTHPLVVTVCDHGEPSLSATVTVEVVVVESLDSGQPSLRQVPMKEEGFSDLNLYLLIAIVSVSVIFLLSLIGLMAAKCCGSEGGLSRCSGPVVTTHPDGSWSYSKATQQYDVCFSSDTLKSDVVVFPSPFPPADAELISINGGDTFTRTQTLPSSGKGTNLFRIGSSSGEIKTKRRMSDHDLKTHPLVVTVCDHGEPSLSATVTVEVVVVESLDMGQPSLRQVPMKEEGFSDLNLYLLIAIVSVSVIFLLSLIGLMAAKCCGSEGGLSRCSGPVVTTHPDGSWSYSKATQQYDVCFSSDTLKSDVVVFPSPFPPADAELISINGGDTFTRTQTLPSSGKGTNLFRIGSSSGEIRTKRRMSDHDLKTHPLVVTVCDHGEPSLSATVTVEVVVVESLDMGQPSLRQVPMKEEGFSDLNLYLLIAIVSVSVIFLLSLIGLIAAKCCGSEGGLSRCSGPVVTTHPDGSWSYSKATQQYDVCFSSDTLKSDVVVFPSPFPPADAELISINGGDTFTRTQTLPSSGKVRASLALQFGYPSFCCVVFSC